MSGTGEVTYSGQAYCLVFKLKLIYPYSWVKTTPLVLQWRARAHVHAAAAKSHAFNFNFSGCS